jgi:hypothetical protein
MGYSDYSSISVDYKALAEEVRDLCRFLQDDLGLNRPASHFEPTVERLWHIVHVMQPPAKIGLAGMEQTLAPALFLLTHPGVGVERGGPSSPPSVIDERMVDQYRRMARRAIEGFVVMQELYQRPLPTEAR